MRKRANILILYFSLDVLRFDNTYSWTRSKELFYAIRVLPITEPVCEQEKVEEEVKEAEVTGETQNEES